MKLPTLKVKRFGKNHYEILGLDSGPMGPYETRAEALDDMQGLLRSMRNEALDEAKSKRKRRKTTRPLAPTSKTTKKGKCNVARRRKRTV